MEELVLFEKTGNIAVLKVNRPLVFNALSKETVDRIDDILELVINDDQIRVLIIAGDGNFAAGADIADMVEKTPEEAGKFLFSGTFSKLEDLVIPTIAAIDGYALGGGLELALSCDLRIASEEAQFGLPEINLGIIPGAGGTVRLPRLIGEAKAKELIFLGSRITAMEAYRCGLISRIVRKEDLADEAMKLAVKLAEKAPLAMRAAKTSVTFACENGKERALDRESEIWVKLFESDDQKEGMKAFLEKRKPEYKGK